MLNQNSQKNATINDVDLERLKENEESKQYVSKNFKDIGD